MQYPKQFLNLAECHHPAVFPKCPRVSKPSAMLPRKSLELPLTPLCFRSECRWSCQTTQKGITGVSDLLLDCWRGQPLHRARPTCPARTLQCDAQLRGLSSEKTMFGPSVCRLRGATPRQQGTLALQQWKLVSASPCASTITNVVLAPCSS